MSAQEAVDATSAFAAVGMPMMERQLSWLLRRKLEHNAFQFIVEHVENAVEAAGAAPPKAARPPAISFIDLSGYTALTEEIGDQAAAERAGRLGTQIQELAHTHGGRVVKLLRDGAMLQFPDPSEAVICGLERAFDGCDGPRVLMRWRGRDGGCPRLLPTLGRRSGS